MWWHFSTPHFLRRSVAQHGAQQRRYIGANVRRARDVLKIEASAAGSPVDRCRDCTSIGMHIRLADHAALALSGCMPHATCHLPHAEWIPCA